MDHVGVGEPFGNVRTFTKPAPELGAGQTQDPVTVWHAGPGHVFTAVLVVHDFLERHEPDPDLVLVLLDQLLGVVRSIEGLPGPVSRTRVVAADDEVRAAVVLADDRVPERLARPGHAHREG